MKSETLEWVHCDSRSQLSAETESKITIGEISTADSNSWGYYNLSKNRCVKISYANVGLTPQSVVYDKYLFIGIDEVLVSYDLSKDIKVFTYRMPFIFQEFVSVGEALIVRDELGFIGLSKNGGESWKFITEGVIETFSVEPPKISGKTVDGETFSYLIPN